MQKNPHMIKALAVGIILLFIGGAFVPVCSAQTSTPQANGEKTSHDCEVKDVKPNNNDDECFFDFAIIWGTFEHKVYSSLFRDVSVYNRKPWCNRTMNVIGYQSWEHKWFVKKSFEVKCNFLHLGIVGRNWLCVIGIGNVDAF